MRSLTGKKLRIGPEFRIAILATLFVLIGLFLLQYFRDSPIKETAYSIRYSVLDRIPIRSSKDQVLDYLDKMEWDKREFSVGPVDPDPSGADILVFNKTGFINSNAYYTFRKENNGIRVDLGSYWDFRKSPVFIARIRVFLYLLFLDEQLVQVRVVKILG
ncbi:hypothetical protein ACE5IS_01005 [Leptospira wolffii]|uniref:Uncharacterized protein n=1 Tax=Leptospira wolffii TaxID=409998 RepID=A0ABV5BJF4_9LEPT|nr:hypothetical protein [Leptospira wolffii]EPG64409.1 hypothetical protein LEP1GSC061_3405 [Leptospira wolffii serovar Khorat str. Khorat-H2]TGL49158.1 hypothetical protein EHQ61_11865 [Leptospira wolffii]